MNHHRQVGRRGLRRSKHTAVLLPRRGDACGPDHHRHQCGYELVDADEHFHNGNEDHKGNDDHHHDGHVDDHIVPRIVPLGTVSCHINVVTSLRVTPFIVTLMLSHYAAT